MTKDECIKWLLEIKGVDKALRLCTEDGVKALRTKTFVIGAHDGIYRYRFGRSDLIRETYAIFAECIFDNSTGNFSNMTWVESGRWAYEDLTETTHV